MGLFASNRGLKAGVQRAFFLFFFFLQKPIQRKLLPMTMRQFLFLLSTLLFTTRPAQAQSCLPWLGANDLYGVCDLDGKVLIEPQFDKPPAIILDQPYFTARKDKQEFICFNNGMVFPKTKNKTRVWQAYNFGNEQYKITDSLEYLFVLEHPDSLVFVNIRTNTSRAFVKTPRQSNPAWVAYPNVFTQTGLRTDMCRFQHGLCLVAVSDGRYNFIDTDLNLLFDTGFEIGYILNATHILLGNSKEKYALANRTGDVLTPYKWDQIWATADPGVFLANIPRQALSSVENKAGILINEQGQTLATLPFDFVTPAGPNALIAGKDKQTGILDFSGNFLLPLQDGNISHAFGDCYMLRSENGKSSLINSTGKKLLDRDFSSLSFTKRAQFAYFQFRDEGTQGAIGTNLKILFEEDCLSLSLFRWDTSTCFLITQPGSPGSKSMVYLRNEQGKRLFTESYEQILLEPNSKDFVEVRKDGMRGMIDRTGKLVLPCIFSMIVWSKKENGGQFYAQKKGEFIYQAYTRDGELAGLPPTLYPGKKNAEPFRLVAEWDEDIPKLALQDGRVLQLPEGWEEPLRFDWIKTPNGMFLLKRTSDGFEAYTDQLKPIIPEGYYLPLRKANFLYLEASGLLPVFKDNRNDPFNRKDSSDPDAPKAVDNSVDACGVLNAKGEWVLEPKANVRYEPRTPNLVLEYPDNGKDRATHLLRVNDPDPIRVKIFDFQSAHPNDAYFSVQAIVEDPALPDRQVPRTGYFRRDGKQIVPFETSNGPRFWGNYNLVRVQLGQNNYSALVDSSYQIIQKWDDLDSELSYSDVLKGGFCAVSKNKKWGIIDSLGQQVLPFEYEYINMLHPGRFFQEFQMKGEKRQLRRWDGTPIGQPHDVVRTQEASDGRIVATLINLEKTSEAAQTLLLNNKDEHIQTIEGSLQHFLDFNGYQFLKIQIHRDVSYWINLDTGRAYREQ
jgi:hypothetical protein